MLIQIEDEKIVVPDDFRFYAGTLFDFAQNCGENQVVTIGRKNADPNCLKYIFDFVDKLRNNDPEYYNRCKIVNENGKVTEFIPKEMEDDKLMPDWMKEFFSSIEKKHLFNALNASLYLECSVFQYYGMVFVKLHMEESNMDLQAVADYLGTPIQFEEDSSSFFSKENWQKIEAEVKESEKTKTKNSKKK